MEKPLKIGEKLLLLILKVYNFPTTNAIFTKLGSNTNLCKALYLTKIEGITRRTAEDVTETVFKMLCLRLCAFKRNDYSF